MEKPTSYNADTDKTTVLALQTLKAFIEDGRPYTLKEEYDAVNGESVLKFTVSVQSAPFNMVYRSIMEGRRVWQDAGDSEESG